MGSMRVCVWRGGGSDAHGMSLFFSLFLYWFCDGGGYGGDNGGGSWVMVLWLVTYDDLVLGSDWELLYK